MYRFQATRKSWPHFGQTVAVGATGPPQAGQFFNLPVMVVLTRIPFSPQALRQRPELTYCCRSRSRPWTPQLGGERAFPGDACRHAIRPFCAIPTQALSIWMKRP